MSQHTNRTFSKPAEPAPQPIAAPVQDAAPRITPRPMEEPPVRKARAFGPRYTVVLSQSEGDKLNALALELHQRLGKRVTMIELFRIALARVNANAPITAEELAAIRALDRRRRAPGRAGAF
ncbi:MAG TPA: hypothetical protein VM008_07565 [Phycisphaerae bacterium]|nr:hypothetical protein [Phycisphaerae bacterium]